MTDLRVGVIGAGIMGTDHAILLDRFVSGARVSAVADVDTRRAEALASGIPGARVLASGEDLIASGAVDAIVVASHDTSHAAFTLAAIERRLPVLCEKPLAPTADECRRVVAAERDAVARGSRDLVSVGFMRRFDPAYVALKDQIAGALIGDTVMLTAQSRGVASAPDATSEFSVTGSAIHEFDVVPWLLDSPIVEIRWFAPASAVPGMADPQLMIARTDDGRLAVIETFLNARYGYDIRCEAVGTTGTAQLVNPASIIRTGDLSRSTRYPSDWRPRFADAYRLELQAWVDSLRSGTPSPLATADDGLRATLVAEAAIASMRSDGAAVQVAP